MADDRRRRAIDKFWARVSAVCSMPWVEPPPEDDVKAALFAALDVMEERGDEPTVASEPGEAAPRTGIRIDVLDDPHGFVLLQVGVPPLLVTSIGMEPGQAGAVAQLLLKHAMLARKAMQ